MNKKKIFIFAEHDCGRIINAYFELLSKARILSSGIKQLEGKPAEICAVVAGEVGDDEIIRVQNSGADRIYILRHEKLNIYNPAVYSEAVARLCSAENPHIFLFGATAMGAEIAPSLGVRLNTGVSAHCIELRIDDSGEFVQDVPAFGGKVIGEIITPNTFPKIATVKPGIFQREGIEPKNAEISIFTPELDSYDAGGIVLKNVHIKERNTLPVDKAETVICGGFGMGCDENWELLERISGYFENSAVGCTRPALDESWVEDDDSMIGTSGRTVRPKLYIGAGISGAMHHVCGISDSELIVSINKDENAEIFNVSDIKIVGDAVKILSAFEQRLGRE